MTEKTKKLTGLIAVIVIVFISALPSLVLLTFPVLIFKILGVIMFIGFITLGRGLMKLSNIARIIAIILYALAIVLDLVMLLTGISKFDIGILIRTVIEIGVIIYLNKPDVKSLFIDGTKGDNQEYGTDPKTIERMRNRYSITVLVGVIISVGSVIFFAMTKKQNQVITPTSKVTQQLAQPSAQPTNVIQLIDKTGDWETYKDDKFGFEIKYPSDWKFEITSDGKFTIKSPGEISPTAGISFSSEKYSITLNQEQAIFDKRQTDIQKISPGVPKAEINDILFAGSPAKEFIYDSPVGFTQQRIILSKNNYTIIVDSYKYSILEQVLATFKFTK